MFALPTSRSTLTFRAAAVAMLTVVLAAACDDAREPTAPAATVPASASAATVAARGKPTTGTQPYGILAHGRIHVQNGVPQIYAGRNVLSVARKSTGLYCVVLPPDVYIDVVIVNAYGGGTATYSQAHSTCDPLGGMPVFTFSVTGALSDDVSFIFLIPES